MFKQSLGWQVRLLGAAATVCLMASAYAQDPSASTSPAPPAGQAAAKAQPATPENDAMLARAAKLYYSSAKAGLNGFTCLVHPDWHGLFVSANRDAAVAPDDARVVLLNGVRITMHARMKGGSTLDWEPASDPNKTLDEASTTLLKSMHEATEQTLQGFLQFWTPFVNGSTIPESSAGLEITPVEGGYSMHAKTSDTEVTETMSNSLILEHFDVKLNEASVKFAPLYQSTAKGLLVSGFQAQILAQGAPLEKAQEMRVAIEYQTVEDMPVPSRLNMEVIGTGIFNFTFDGCTVDKQAK